MILDAKVIFEDNVRIRSPKLSHCQIIRIDIKITIKNNNEIYCLKYMYQTIYVNFKTSKEYRKHMDEIYRNINVW